MLRSEPVDPESALDPLLIADACGIGSARRARRVAGGADTLIWRVETDAGPIAVRVFRADQAVPAAREREALGAALAAGIAAPAVLASGEIAGRPVTILEWCPGEPLLGRLLASDADLDGLGRAFGRTQASIHRIAAPASWSAGRTDVLLHLDYHPLNVLVHGDRISAVIDWVNTRAGDPRHDVARTYSILTADPTAGDVDRSLVRSFRHAWLDGYADAAGARPAELAAFVAWAGSHMGRDLAQRHGPAELAAIDRWTMGWQRRARGTLAPGPVAQR